MSSSIFEGTIKLPMASCRYFTTMGGCSRGSKCRYQHDQVKDSRQPRRSSNAVKPEPALKWTNGNSLAVNDAFSSSAKGICRFFIRGSCAKGSSCSFKHIADGVPITGSSLIQAPCPAFVGGSKDEICRFFALGLCRNGDNCTYSHERRIVEIGKKEAAMELAGNTLLHPLKLDPPVSTGSSFMEFGGALVQFGPGGVVSSIKPTEASTARLQMCNVSCMWYQPSKTATIQFSSTQGMEDASYILRKTPILGRTLSCRTAVNKRTRPWQCLVKVGNLDTHITSKMLNSACKHSRPQDIILGKDSYSCSSEDIFQALRKLLSSVGPIDPLAEAPSKNGIQNKAIVTFSSKEHAARAVVELNGYYLPQLGGSKVFLSHMVKAKFSIMDPMYKAVESDILSVKENWHSEDFLEIKSYPSSNRFQHFTTMHILSTTPQVVRTVKGVIDKILLGHTAGGNKVIWNDFFLKAEGVASLNNLGKKHNVFIYRDVRRRTLRLYGKDADKACVESDLLEAIRTLTTSTVTFELEGSILASALGGGYRRIVEKLGRAAARLNVVREPKVLIIKGSREDIVWAKGVLEKDYNESPRTEADANDLICAVCWCEVSDKYLTPCGHAYDTECFLDQCLSAESKDIPIRCMGAAGTCQCVIPFPELEENLDRDQLQRLLNTSFTCHIRAHPETYQYCPTADCNQVYGVSDDGKIFTCPTCMSCICTKCGAISHEGLTCEQSRSTKEVDEAFLRWKIANDARDCPKCGTTIQKSEGCNHMECKACHTHICWVCTEVFTTGDETYKHLTEKHGGCYDPGYGVI